MTPTPMNPSRTPTPARAGARGLALVAQLCLVSAAVAGWACAQNDDQAAGIVVDGPHSLRVGETISLAAQTEHGTDHDYGWASSDEDIATVTSTGAVTGVAPGEAVIVATGLDTGRSAEHLVIVIGSDGEDGPYYDLWLSSAHADATAEAFNHWNEDGEIPTDCARCHSREGFQDYIGADGSEQAVVNQPAPLGSVVDCDACHNQAATALDWVEFPSGVKVSDLGPEARCITCHQGRASGDDVEAQITEVGELVGGLGDDETSSELSFTNVHYYAAGATLYAGIARGGYQYEGELYDRRFRHVPGQDTCVGCHDPHSAKVRWDGCAECHSGVEDVLGARDIRMIASFNVDYDGDGDTAEGIYHEIVGLQELLYLAIQRYASEVAGQTLCYSSSYPYWFNSSTGAFAECSDADASFDNGFASWSPRLLRAAYNYQTTRLDPAGFAHNSRYVVKLLHDAIVDLNTQLNEPVDLSNANRNAPGHFNAASEAARHWDEDEAVSASCSSCHSGAPGYRFYVEFGTGLEVAETANGMECYTCHENFGTSYDLLAVDKTRYPGGLEIEHEGHDNMCATCHSGRESKATIDASIANDDLRFRNVHYLPAAGVRNGSLSHVGYEYDGKSYAGYLEHDSRTRCAGCHEPVTSNHTFRIADVWAPTCQTCHNDEAGPEEVRGDNRVDDYDGDGSNTETLVGELDGLGTLLLAQMQTLDSICYEAHTYPYWFVDNGGAADGICAEADANFGNQFMAWTPALMKAAHNYQIYVKDPGAYAHNFSYMAQLLIDSVEELGGDISGLTRP